MAQSNQPSRFNVAGSFIHSRPQEEFRANTSDGFGAGGTFLYHLNRAGWASVRFDASWMQYGKETLRVPLSETIEAFNAIADGKYDSVPEQAFFMCGGIEDLEKNAAELAKK